MSNRVRLDARRLLCPLPVIKMQNMASDLRPGQEIEAVCTDPGVLHDIPAWCRINGHEVLESKSDRNEYILIIRIGG
ncbi:MAG: sulfurtransferase TusA family protein [Gammaproteobacteria bacterium]|nr:sulfurtransferase TusA family protein [Gammaproteobacteria bacterium]MBU1656204.1 sulfurtransferase TusA family protein [Gammaproteobacteria bacterium]MBU1959769.1 sulfurtransferase TusA family protein [Gammaproteobacteria bacterium]